MKYNVIRNGLCVIFQSNVRISNFVKRDLSHASRVLFKTACETPATSTMKVLNVAEKNDVAKNIANILSRGGSTRRDGFSVYNKIYEFDYNVLGRNQKMVVTSVCGHLLNWEFSAPYRGWQQCQPVQLFEAPVFKNCKEETADKVKRTLEREVKYCNTLIIWTDCDREGENIGYEVINVCTAIKPNLQIYRAKFSEVTHRSITRAIENLDRPNKLVSDAVDVRSELDLRIGAAFTRFQTLRLKRIFPAQLADSLISYGSCQFPTLGFVVERYNEINNFVPENFWKIKVDHKIDELNVEFSWKRNRLFDEMFCRVLYERCLENPLATVERIISKPTTKWRPIPLDTIAFEKMASKKLGINAKVAMTIAEKLYTQGFISYPRTETNIFPKEMNLQNLVQQQTEDPNWGEFAAQVAEYGPNPRQGKKTDEAHPPIHPTKYTSNLGGDERKLYEFIVRHFLACVSKDAKGHSTTVDIDINGEKFTARGLMILERNYLEVYPYEKWSDKEIHMYQEGQTFHPTNINMVDGSTSPPNLLTEADLISLMEKHGIGTDATHAEHIETIKSRLYVGLTDNKYFVPGQLGMGLVEGYDSMGFAMSKPHLRAELEADLKRICDGVKDPKIVLTEQIRKYKDVFVEAQTQVEKLDVALGKYLQEAPRPYVAEEHVINTVQSVSKCTSCGSDMIIKKRNATGGYYISCSGYPHCRRAIWFPETVLNLEASQDSCAQCGPDVKQLLFTFRPGALAPFYPNRHKGCVNGCDQHFIELLNIRTPSASSQSQSAPQSSGGSSTNQGSNFNRYSSLSNSRQSGSTQSSSSRTTSNWFSQSQKRQHDDTVEQPRQRTFQRANEINNDGDGDGETHCNCGIPAKRLIVQKESVNKGRPFYKCGKTQRDEWCRFFKWADEENENTNRPQDTFRGTNNFNGRGRGRGGHFGGGSSQRNTGGGGNSQRKCSVCHRPGHTRRNCPNID